jgi:phosphoribosyl 1,2-cyclic phosphodiesterase
VSLDVTFYGVRGSTPCGCEANRRYGGNTSCVVVEAAGHDPILLDMGTGMRFFGETQPWDGSFRGTTLVTHLHWDHVQGLPFFVPVLRPGASMTIYGPKPEDGRSLRDVFDGLMSPPYFPVTVADLPGEIRFEGVEEGWFEASGARVLARAVPHTGLTFGFRLELNGLVIAYIPDHQQPHDGSFDIAEGVLELVTGADLLVHDAQYTPEEFDRKRTWGHCTSEYAVAVATAGRVRKLALFHHDPAHDDTFLDDLARQQAAAAPGTLEVIVAAEGMRLTLGAAAAGGASARRAAVSPST